MPGESRRTRRRGHEALECHRDLGLLTTDPFGDRSRRLGEACQLAREPDLLLRERHLDQLDLHPGFRPGKTVRKRIQRISQPFVDID